MLLLFSDFVTSWPGVENLELVIDSAGDQYDDELETEDESDSDDESGEPSAKRDFYKYSIEQMEDMVHLYFTNDWAFNTIKHKYKRLTTINEIYR
jgi:hypothetical protein